MYSIDSTFSNLYLVLIFAIMFLFMLGLIAIAVSGRKDKDIAGDVDLNVLVIVPCRGLDYTLRDNLERISKQDYHKFSVIAVVDSQDDPAVEYIRAAGMNFITAEFDCRRCSGKVRAISTALKKFPDYEVYVIADSDISPESTWLTRLISPFSDSTIGISTTFPYFLPVGGFWSKVKLVWGFVGLGLMESKLTRFGWGGSLALREDIIKGPNLEFFSNSISDDIALTRLCKKEGKEIAYVESARPIVNSPEDFRTFLEWSNRQTALSVYGSKSVLYYGLLIYSATIVMFLSSIILSLFVNPVFLVFLTPTFINAGKAMSRARKYYLTTFIVSIILPFLYMYNLLHATRTRSIMWRGRSYELRS